MTIHNLKTIWLVNQYSSTLDSGIGGRHYYFAKELAKQGHNVYLISASYHHLLKQPYPQNEPTMIQKIDGFHFMTLKMPIYQHAHSKQRIINEIRFNIALKKLYKHNQINKPDIIWYSSPSLIPSLGATYLSKKMQAKLLFEVRDIWPLTLIEIGGYSPKHPFIQLLAYIEKKAYKSADFFISNLPLAINHMSQFGVDNQKFIWLPNGFSLKDFQNPDTLPESVKNLLPKDKFIVMYTGTLGHANAIPTLLQAAAQLKDKPEIAIVLVGEGKEKNEFIEYAKQHQLQNVHFLPAIAKKQIPNMLAQADVCYVGMLNSPLYRFGTALTKLPEYLASQKPIIYGSNSPFQPIKEAQAGITIDAEDPSQLRDAIIQMFETKLEERLLMGKRGYEYAIQNFDFNKITDKFTKQFLL